jgi:hypothetical protein
MNVKIILIQKKLIVGIVVGIYIMDMDMDHGYGHAP